MCHFLCFLFGVLWQHKAKSLGFLSGISHSPPAVTRVHKRTKILIQVHVKHEILRTCDAHEFVDDFWEKPCTKVRSRWNFWPSYWRLNETPLWLPSSDRHTPASPEGRLAHVSPCLEEISQQRWQACLRSSWCGINTADAATFLRVARIWKLPQKQALGVSSLSLCPFVAGIPVSTLPNRFSDSTNFF